MNKSQKTKKEPVREIEQFRNNADVLQSTAENKNGSINNVFFKRILNALDDLVFVKDSYHRWIFLNDACCRFWGCSREELIGKSDYDYFPKEQADVYWEKDEEVFRTKKSNLNIEEQTIHGKLHTIATVKSYYKEKHTGFEYIVGTIRDITDHAKADKLLRESEEKFRNLAESSPNMIFINHRGKVVYVNRKCEEVMGYPREEFLTQDFNFLRIITPESQKTVVAAFETHCGGEEVSPYEYQLVTKDGRKLDVIITTKLINFEGAQAIMGIVTDISDLKRSQEKLMDSEERYRNLLELSPIGILTIDLKGKVLSVNRAFQEISGFHSDEMVGRHFTKIPILLKRNVPDFIKLFNKMLGGKNPSPVHFRYKRKDGSVRWAEAHTGFVIEGGKKSGIQTIVQDITERHEYEENLRNSELLSRSTIESLGDAIHMVDRDLRIIFYNKALKEWNRELGFESESQGKLLMEVYNFLNDEVRAEYERVFKTGKLMISEDQSNIGGRTIITETRKIPVLENGKVTKVLTVVRDITEQKRAVEALRESEQQYRTLFDSVGDAIFIYDNTGRCIAVNEIAVEWLGYTRDEIMQLSWKDILSDNRCDWAKDFYNQELPKKQEIFEASCLCKDGRRIPVEVICRWIDYYGKPGVLSVARDISERKQAEKALKQSEEMLRQAQKMEAIGRLAGGVAHDFNNLLTAILGYTDILRLNSTLGGNEELYVGEIKRSAERAALLTQRLLAFSRKQVLQPKVFNLNTLIRNLQKMLIRIIGEDIHLVTKLSPKLGNVKADPGQVENVIINLVVNARDAIPEGGTITIETGNDYLTDRYCHLGQRIPAGEYVYFTVRDTGTGIDKKISQQIFEPFFTTKEKGKGTGLGLSMVYGIVNQSNGYIFLDSTVGKGTSFKVTLPVIHGKRSSKQEEGINEKPAGGCETILVVEDEEMVRRMISSSLKTFGYTLIEAESTFDAIDKYSNSEIDLVITDVIMPGMSGSDLVQRLNSTYGEFKVLYISGYTGDAIGKHGVLDESMFFLQKPFTPLQLAEKVREILDQM